MPTPQESLVVCFNPAPFSPAPGAEARIGWIATASGNAMLVALVGAPIVVAVNLDLADDEVAIGGPDSAGVRRLFRGRDNGDGTNAIENVPQASPAGTSGQVLIASAVGGTLIVAANTARRLLIVWNVGSRPVDVFLAAAAGAVGTGAEIPVAAGAGMEPLVLPYRGALSGIRPGGGANGRIAFVEVTD